MASTWKNQLYFGDNLDILREHIAAESVDLIYLDPPFNSNATYNVLFKEQSGERSSAQIDAFEDTWHWGEDAERIFYETVTNGPERLSDLLQALRTFLGQSDLMAYLTMMAPRLVDLHRVLKTTGSLYLHCDPTASHYLKLVLDAVAGPTHFRNEIIWLRATPRGHAFTRFATSHDVILCFSKSEETTWNPDGAVHKYDLANLDDKTDQKYALRDPDGRRFQLTSLLNPNPDRPKLTYEFLGVTRVWRWTKERMTEAYERGLVVQSRHGGIPRFKRYLDEQRGKPIGDVWTDIPPINSQAQERLGYPTQKPEALLERIIKASSHEGALILDPFCGCGTSISVAERLRRRWIGIDVTHLAIGLMKYRLRDTFGSELAPFEVIGDPKDVASARALAELDRYQFQWWAVWAAGGLPAQGKKRGADSGIDGYINFFDDSSGKAKRLVMQVKSGHVGVRDIRDLKGVLARERAEIGVYICIERPTSPMIKEALSTGFYTPTMYPGLRLPRIQLLTVEELLAGKQPEYPRTGTPQVKRAERKSKVEQTGLFND